MTDVQEGASRGTVSTVPLDAIRVEADLQPRYMMYASFIGEYADAMRAGDEFPPVVLFLDADGVYWLADGFHRFNAARVVGREVIRADVRAGDRDAAIRHSLGANATHGIRRTNADKRRAVERCLARYVGKETRPGSPEIAAECRVTDRFVREMLGEAGRNGSDLPSSIEGRDGKTYAAPAPDPSTNGMYAPSAFVPSPEFLFENRPIADFMTAAEIREELRTLAPPPPPEREALHQVIMLSHVMRFDPAALAATLDAHDAAIQAPTLRAFTEWMAALSAALAAVPRLKAL